MTLKMFFTHSIQVVQTDHFVQIVAAIFIFSIANLTPAKLKKM